MCPVRPVSNQEVTDRELLVLNEEFSVCGKILKR